MSLNKVCLIGNLGKDPEIRQLPSGGSVANFSLATSETWKDKTTGEKKEKTEWHNIAVFGPIVDHVIVPYVKKGSKLYLEGKLQTRKWQDNDGNDRYTTEIVLNGFGSILQMLNKVDGSQVAPQQQPRQPQQQMQPVYQQQQQQQQQQPQQQQQMQPAYQQPQQMAQQQQQAPAIDFDKDIPF